MPRQISPSNAWCFTLNNWTESEYEFLSSKLLGLGDKYFYIVGKEVGETGTPHLQGYVALKDGTKKFRPLPTFAVTRVGTDSEGTAVNAVHFERAKGTRRQNYLYCSKEGDFVTNIPKPALTVKEATEIVGAEHAPGANGAQREAAARALVGTDVDVMRSDWASFLNGKGHTSA